MGVHVRRTDYVRHVVDNYPGAVAATANFYRHAIRWMVQQLAPRPLALVVTSDDLAWCRHYLTHLEVATFFLGGQERGKDLALMAACNHSIFDYGTFGLTGAMLAQGRYTVLFDTGNYSYTKEMEFVHRLPGWYAMDNDGKFLDSYIKYPTTFANG